MLDKISIIKKKLMESMSQLCEVSWMFIKDPKRDPTVFYKLPFRIARFQIADGVYKTVVTNLDRCKFPALELKQLYNMRWGIETSFRELKYTVGLLHFHAKKVEHICQRFLPDSPCTTLLSWLPRP